MPSLQERIRPLIDRNVGDRAVVVSVEVRTRRGVALALEADRGHYAASTMKLPVLIAAYRLRDAGRLDLSAPVEVHDRFDSGAGGLFALDREDDSDPEVWDRVGATASLEWLCRRMIIRSSNLATDLVLEQVGFPAVAEAIGQASGADGLLVLRMIGDYAAQDDGRSNLVTAAGMNALLLGLDRGSVAAPSSCAEILDVLAANEVATDVRPGLPAGTWVAHKNGWVSDAVHDAALVRPDDADPFALTVLTSGAWMDLPAGADPVSEEDMDEELVQAGNDRGHALIRQIAAAVWESRHDL